MFYVGIHTKGVCRICTRSSRCDFRWEPVSNPNPNPNPNPKLRGKIDVLRVIGNFLGLEHWTAAEKIKTAVSRIEAIEWDNYDE